MLYYYKKGSRLEKLPPIADLNFEESDDPLLLSLLCKISLDESRRRLANDHTAYVAYYKNQPAAFGWMAAGKARIGELNHEIILPLGHRYLWNFRTLEEFRGLGIYPQLLQYILLTKLTGTECFWILHAPENRASEKGIVKAGFQLTSNVSVRNGVIFVNGSESDQYIEELPDSFGFSLSAEEQATCWKCSSPYLAHRKTSCCCEEDFRMCNQELFMS